MTYTLVHDGLDDFWINGVPFIFPKGERAGKGDERRIGRLDVDAAPQ